MKRIGRPGHAREACQFTQSMAVFFIKVSRALELLETQPTRGYLVKVLCLNQSCLAFEDLATTNSESREDSRTGASRRHPTITPGFAKASPNIAAGRSVGSGSDFSDLP